MYPQCTTNSTFSAAVHNLTLFTMVLFTRDGPQIDRSCLGYESPVRLTDACSGCIIDGTSVRDALQCRLLSKKFEKFCDEDVRTMKLQWVKVLEWVHEIHAGGVAIFPDNPNKEV